MRNEIAIDSVIALLEIPTKHRDGHLRFLCPMCSEFRTATHPTTNLARCFRCQRNFNPIDLVLLVDRTDFVTAVRFLAPLLATHEPEGTQRGVHRLP